MSESEIKECLEGFRPDVCPVASPKKQLNLQEKEALRVFVAAEKLHADPGYENVLSTARLLVTKVADESSMEPKLLAQLMADADFESEGLSLEEADSRELFYRDAYRKTEYSHIVSRILNDELPKDSPLYEFLQPGASSLGRLAILESLGLNKENIEGIIRLGEVSYSFIDKESKEFFALTEEEREKQLGELLNQAKSEVKRRREHEKQCKEQADYERMLGYNIEEATEKIKNYVKAWQQEGYSFLSTSGSTSGREKIEFVKGSLAELRQALPDLCYPSGLNLFDRFLEDGVSGSTEFAVLIGARVFGKDRLYVTLGVDAATVYKKQDSPED